MSYRAVILADGPIGYWPLDEPSGTNAADVAGANPLTYAGAFTLAQPSLIANDPPSTSVSFGGGDAANGAVSFSGPTRSSLEAWVYYTAQPAAAANVLNLFGNVAWIGFNASGFPEVLFFNSSSNITAIGAATLALGTPHHLVGTYDGAAVRIYVDGVQVTQTANAGTTGWSTTKNVTVAAASGGTASKFAGQVAHAAFYGFALSATQVLGHYTAAFPAAPASAAPTSRNTLQRGVRNRGQMALYRQRMPQPMVAAGPVVNQSSLTAALSFTGSEQRTIGTTLAAVLSFTGSLSRATVKLLAAALTFTGALVKTIAKRLAGALSFTGALSFGHLFARAFTAALSFTGSQSRQTAKKLTGVLTFSGARVLAVGRPLSAGLSFTGAQARSTASHLTAALSFTGAVTKQTAKKLTAAVLTFSGTFTTQAVHFFTQSFAATLTFAGATTRKTGKALAGALSFTGRQSRAIVHTLTAVVSFIGVQARAITQHLTAALSFAGRTLKAIAKKLTAAALAFAGAFTAIKGGSAPAICYPTTATILPYGSSSAFVAYTSTASTAAYTTTSAFTVYASTPALSGYHATGAIAGYASTITTVVYTSSVSHLGTCPPV